MYSKQSYVNQTDSSQSENEIWSDLTKSELQYVIMSSNLNKAPEPNEISFMIIQKAYNSILKLFYILYHKLIKHDYHTLIWRKGLEAILKKSNKPDYSNLKVYKIITLLECLDKISEKIVAKKLAYCINLVDIKSQ